MKRTYVLEASVEGLQLLPGELGLSLQLVETLRLVTHRRQLQVTVAAVCGRKRQTNRKRWRGRKMERERGEDGADIQCVDAGQHSGRGGITHSTERHLLKSRWGKRASVRESKKRRGGTFFVVEMSQNILICLL